MEQPTPHVDGQRLAADTHMDLVTLLVGDLDNMSSYYERALAMEPIEERANGREVHRILGRGDTPMLHLVARPDLPTGDHTQAGLFHNAFLFDNEASLAATVYRAAQDPRSRFVGSSDHLVSEAFYFTDPEGNGIELYRDRPRDRWTVIDGQTQMDTIFLDPNAYLRRHLVEADAETAEIQPASVGHVHLQVGNLIQARRFYVDAIGFEVSFDRMSSALFFSAGGYHHHMAMNIWNSRGAGPRAASLGLGDVTITVTAREQLAALRERLTRASIPFADHGNRVVTRDPWNTQITVALPGRSALSVLQAA